MPDRVRRPTYNALTFQSYLSFIGDMQQSPPPLPLEVEPKSLATKTVEVGSMIAGFLVFAYTFLMMSYSNDTYAEGDYAWVHWYFTSGMHFLSMLFLSIVTIVLHLSCSLGTRWQRLGKAVPSVALLSASAMLVLFILLVQFLGSVRWN